MPPYRAPTKDMRAIGAKLAPTRHTSSGLRLMQVIVTASSAGPPKTVTIKLHAAGAEITGIRYFDSYTPGTLPETVWALANGSDVQVLGRLA
jgi:hypothetical protein